MARIAVVNDDTQFLSLMSELLEMEGHQTIVIRESSRAFTAISEQLPDLVILDIRLNSAEQGWMICELLTLDPRTTGIPLIICSAALGELREKVQWLGEHQIGALPKPFDIDDLYQSVRVALDTGRPITIGL